MNIPDTKLEILTLGRFSISADEKQVAIDWPNEAIKIFFCSLLSPLDLYFTWDRICRSMLGEPETRTSRRQLKEVLIQPLNNILIKELGFTPLITEHDNIRINQKHIHLDALEFYNSALDGLRLLTHDNHAAAFEKFSTANSLYAGIYLPGMSGKIIENTRNELESLYQNAFIGGFKQTPLRRFE